MALENLDYDFEQTIVDELLRTKLDSSTFQRPLKELPCYSPIAFNSNAKLLDAINTLNSKNIGALVVLEDRKLVGIFSERDFLRRVVGKIRYWEELSIKEVMTPMPMYLGPDDTILNAITLMTEGSYRHLPLVNEEGDVLTLISMKDILSWLITIIRIEKSQE